jgi:hypothetical protein
MTKNEVTKYTEQEKLLQEMGMLDDESDYKPAPSFPRLKIDIDKVTKDGKNSKFYLLDNEEVTELGKSIEVRPVYSQRTNALFRDGSDELVCSAINGIPNSAEPKSPTCATCQYGQFKGECKPKVRLFCIIKINGEWIPTVTNITTSSIKHWDKFCRRLDGNKPRALKYWYVEAKATLLHMTKSSFIWDEVEWTDEQLTPVDVLKEVAAARKDLIPAVGEVDAGDYTEKGDRPEYPPATGHVEEPQQKGTDSVDSEQSDLPF